MKLEFYGAAECVTGSCHVLRVRDKNILLDCGLYQGKDERERGNENFPFNPKEIDYVILSHAHIDHSGRIPLLYKMGFRGEVICTTATLDLCSVMLPDSGHIQEMEVEWKNRKRIRQGMELIQPIYTAKIAQASMYVFNGYAYDEEVELFDGFKIRFRDAGHLLGSAIVEMYITENDKEVKLVYTGDLGNINIPIIKDPTEIEDADYIIMETTYGDRRHNDVDIERQGLANIIKDTIKNGGNVVIPSFSVGRAQELLYELHKFVENDQLKGVKVFVDSPLAFESTKIFEKHTESYDEDAMKIVNKGANPLEFEGLLFTKSPEESARINKVQQGAVIISASGMCEAGRIKHHLKHNLWRKECAIVFVGYQAEGTLGRTIVEGARKVKIFGETIAVNAKIYKLDSLSGHADRNGLYNWLQGFKSKPKEVLLIHGSETAQQSFKQLLCENGYNARIMGLGDSYYINEKCEGDAVEAINLNEGIRPKRDAEAGRKIKERIFALLESMEDAELTDNEAVLSKINDILRKKNR